MNQSPELKKFVDASSEFTILRRTVNDQLNLLVRLASYNQGEIDLTPEPTQEEWLIINNAFTHAEWHKKSLGAVQFRFFGQTFLLWADYHISPSYGSMAQLNTYHVLTDPGGKPPEFIKKLDDMLINVKPDKANRSVLLELDGNPSNPTPTITTRWSDKMDNLQQCYLMKLMKEVFRY